MGAADHLIRPIKVEIWRRGDGVRVAFWTCRACDYADGWADADQLGAAIDAGLAHLPRCATVQAALDRLLADVMALPEYRRVWVADQCGRVGEVVVCLDCGHPVLDEVEHLVTHIEAVDRAREAARHG